MITGNKCRVTNTSIESYIKGKRRDLSMAIVKTIEHGACTVYIHDDSVVHTKEEKQQINLHYRKEDNGRQETEE